jgi:PadR family transcriptional regulator PadR
MGTDGSPSASGTSRFEMAPPRHFLLPAVLMLLCEKPSHGYALVTDLADLRFGSVDRPAVYRALAQLQRDGLVEDSSESPIAGPVRRVYRVTPAGERVLRSWMGAIKETHDHLGEVLRRYQALGTTDAVLAEVEGGWAASLGTPSWSQPPLGARPARHLFPVEDPQPPAEAGEAPPRIDGVFRLLPDRSVVLIEVRSTVGPLSFGTTGVRGWIRAAVRGGQVDLATSPEAHIEVDVAGLTSGSSVYDAELLRRIDARRHPSSVVTMDKCTPAGGSMYLVQGSLTFHGVTRPAEGTVSLRVAPGPKLVVVGEQAFDIRDFSLTSPAMLMLRIYPDVKVQLHVEAVPDVAKDEETTPCESS